jgi:hypothetical protein
VPKIDAVQDEHSSRDTNTSDVSHSSSPRPEQAHDPQTPLEALSQALRSSRNNSTEPDTTASSTTPPQQELNDKLEAIASCILRLSQSDVALLSYELRRGYYDNQVPAAKQVFDPQFLGLRERLADVLRGQSWFSPVATVSLIRKASNQCDAEKRDLFLAKYQFLLQVRSEP